MLDDVIAAFNRQDYQTAARLLKDLKQQSPQNPWVIFYIGRLQEVGGKVEQAAAIYRQLLQESLNPKLMTQARQGLQRLERMQQESRQQTIAQATADPDSREPGFLALQAVAPAAKSEAVQSLARIMKLDPYTARLLLPNRGWRLYRTGPIGELQVYGKALRDAGVPAYWAALPDLQKIRVFRVKFFQMVSPQATIVCQNAQDQLGYITFNWSEVARRVEGLLPIFEQVLELGYRNRLERKEQTQDYAQLCDLHVPSRQCILRLQDSQYDFHQGVSVLSPEAEIDPLDRTTLRTHWNGLMEVLNHHLPAVQIWSDFTTFGETAADFGVPLSRLTPHIQVLRQTESHWDSAFQLYSGLLFLQKQAPQATLS